MDFNYNVKSIVPSLKDMSAIILAREVLEEFEDELRDRNTRDTVEEKAISSIQNLDLLDDYKNLIEAFVKPLVDELCLWYNFQSLGKPVLTQLGTLDLSVEIETRREDEICEVLNVTSITDHDCFYRNTYLMFSPGSSYNNAKKRWLHEKQYGNPFTFKYSTPEDRELHAKFLKEATIHSRRKQASSTDLPPNQLIQRHQSSSCNRSELEHTPEMLCYLFSKINENRSDTDIQRPDLMNKLLFLLLKWPYQRFFSDASRALIPRITTSDYWAILRDIIEKINNGYKDWKYRDMFIEFWNLGEVQRVNETPHVRYDEYLVLHGLFFGNDIFLLHFFTNNISSVFKRKLFVCFDYEITCSFLKHQNIFFERFELFIRCCGTDSIQLLKKYKNKCFRKCEKDPAKSELYSFRHDYDRHYPLSEVQWKDRLSKMAGIVDKIISELPTE